MKFEQFYCLYSYLYVFVKRITIELQATYNEIIWIRPIIHRNLNANRPRNIYRILKLNTS